MSTRPLNQRLVRQWRKGGLQWFVGALFDRIAPARPAMADEVLAAVKDHRGLEVGGPSRVFGRRGMLPVYPRAGHLDNVNFSTQTTWEDGIVDGGEFCFDPRHAPGTQWVREAVALTGLLDGSYDFVLSSHCLEHVANPFQALHEWKRVTRGHGYLLLILPDREKTFDHRRPVTSLAHLRADFDRGTREDDMTHVAEILALHDLARDPGVGSADEFRVRAEHNAENRCLHHHVFDLNLMESALRETGWSLLATEKARPLHLVALARKAGP